MKRVIGKPPRNASAKKTNAVGARMSSSAVDRLKPPAAWVKNSARRAAQRETRGLTHRVDMVNAHSG